MRTIRALLVAVLFSLTTVLFGAAPAHAHEPRAFNGMDVEVGWVAEPPTTGVLNGVIFIAHDAKGNTVSGLKVAAEVTYQGQTLPKMDLEGSDEDPAVYSAAFIPTRPGEYDFHITGTAKDGSAIDQTFKAGKGLEEVGDATDIEFPVKDPSVGQLALAASRADLRVAAAKDSASSAKTFGYIGIGVGALALIVALLSVRRKGKAAA